MTVSDLAGYAHSVSEDSGLEHLRTYEQIAGRNAAIGAVIGFVVCVAAVFGVGLSAHVEPGGALALGVFVGIWSGVGFGFMVGGTKYIAGSH